MKVSLTNDGPVVGLHPIFRPTISSPENQVIVVCDGKQQDNKYQYFINDLARIGFSIEKMTAETHDEEMTFQGIEHFSVYCLGLFLKYKKY